MVHELERGGGGEWDFVLFSRGWWVEAIWYLLLGWKRSCIVEVFGWMVVSHNLLSIFLFLFFTFHFSFSPPMGQSDVRRRLNGETGKKVG